MRACFGAESMLIIFAFVAVAGCVSGNSDSGERSIIEQGWDSVAGLGAKAVASGAAETDPYIARQEQELQKQLAGSNFSIARANDQLVVTAPSADLFDTDKDMLRAGSKDELDIIAAVLKKNPRTTVDVYGHTDTGGNEKENLDLTQRRALAVARYLTEQGVDARRLSVTGFGSSRPLESNDTAEGRARNRRIEIQISPAKKR